MRCGQSSTEPRPRPKASKQRRGRSSEKGRPSVGNMCAVKDRRKMSGSAAGCLHESGSRLPQSKGDFASLPLSTIRYHLPPIEIAPD